MPADTPRSFQEIILRLQAYWAAQGCAILQPYDMEVGAGTFHPATTLRALGPAALVRGLRPALAPPDRRPLRRQPEPLAALLPVPGHHQTLAARPAGHLPRLAAPPSASTWTLHDIRFVEDDWESPTLGAWGLGWEVWCDGMEVSQFTYFQQVGGHDCRPVSGELTYGLERLAMYVLGFDDGNLMPFNDPAAPIPLTYGDVFREAEARIRPLELRRRRHRRCCSATSRTPRPSAPASSPSPSIDPKTGRRIVMALPAYDQCIKARHLFNLLDARGVISVTERQAYIGRVRALAKACADAYRRRRPSRHERPPADDRLPRLPRASSPRRSSGSSSSPTTSAQRGVGALTVAGAAVPVADYDGIDAASSPLKLRGCFRIDPAAVAAPRPGAATPTPLTAPFWFRCFDAGRAHRATSPPAPPRAYAHRPRRARRASTSCSPSIPTAAATSGASSTPSSRTSAMPQIQLPDFMADHLRPRHLPDRRGDQQPRRRAAPLQHPRPGHRRPARRRSASSRSTSPASPRSASTPTPATSCCSIFFTGIGLNARISDLRQGRPPARHPRRASPPSCSSCRTSSAASRAWIAGLPLGHRRRRSARPRCSAATARSSPGRPSSPPAASPARPRSASPWPPSASSSPRSSAARSAAC